MSLPVSVLEAAKARGVMIATAESCTGGMVAAALTDIPGSSAVVDRGMVTYTNAAKVEMLGVSPETLDAFGAVSEKQPPKWPQARCATATHRWPCQSPESQAPAGRITSPRDASVSGWPTPMV